VRQRIPDLSGIGKARLPIVGVVEDAITMAVGCGHFVMFFTENKLGESSTKDSQFFRHKCHRSFLTSPNRMQMFFMPFAPVTSI